MNDRQAQILALLKSEESVAIADLSRILGVSRETVRKDLYSLELDGLLTKVRGGAVLTASNAETAYDLRLGRRREAKQLIAGEAVKLVAPGSTVFLDYGTTTFMIATELIQVDGVTVATNALPIAERLAGTPSMSVMLLGGLIRGNENSLYGPLAARSLRHLHFDIGFFGCSGVDARVGFTNPNQLESEVSSLAMDRCGSVVMAVDSSKFGVIAANVTAPVSLPDLLITDADAPEPILRELDLAGLAVRIAKPDTNERN